MSPLYGRHRIYASTQAEAEAVLLTWQSALASYELMVNPAKTDILQGPLQVERPWRTELAQFRFRQISDRVAANDIYSFFSRAFELAKDVRVEPVLAYAISRAAAEVRGQASASALQHLMLPAVMVDPSCLRYVAQALQRIDDASYTVLRGRLEETLNNICEYHAQREHGSEVTWALWLLRRYRLQVADGSAMRSRKCRITVRSFFYLI